MTSLLTNVSAMTALKTLSSTNRSIETVQSRISTGLAVSQASDNAAYWSIATTMRSDNNALATVQDSLGLGAATVDVAYTAMDATKDVLDEMKSKLVAAKQTGVDKSKIQGEIAQLQEQLQGIASAATFSGTNWLSVDSASASYKAAESIVSSFARDTTGTVSIGTIDIDITGISLIDASGTGLLEGTPMDSVGGLDNQTDTDAVDIGNTGMGIGFAIFEPFAMDDDDVIMFEFSVDGDPAVTVEVTKQHVDDHYGNSDGVVGDQADYAEILADAIEDAGLVRGSDFDVSSGYSGFGFWSQDTTASSHVSVTNVRSSTTGSFVNALEIDVTDATDEDLDTFVAGVDAMAKAVTSAAADLGAVKSRISMQSDFAGALMDAIDRGIGQLVDADMSEESTRLQALQVQQQLGIQSLSIANSNAQTILSLFR